MESRFAVESSFISAVGAELQLSYGRIQLCGGGRSQYCSELAPLVERPSNFLNPSIPDRKYMFRIGTCMKTNFVIDRRFRSAEVSELQLFYGRSRVCGGRSQCSLTSICFTWHCPISLMWCSASDFNSVPFLAVQDSSISDIVCLSVCRSEPTNNQSLLRDI